MDVRTPFRRKATAGVTRKGDFRLDWGGGGSGHGERRGSGSVVEKRSQQHLAIGVGVAPRFLSGAPGWMVMPFPETRNVGGRAGFRENMML